MHHDHVGMHHDHSGIPAATASPMDAASMFDLIPDTSDLQASHAGHAAHGAHNHGGGSGTGMEHMMPMAVRERSI